jgi:preprotein translocase SecE subunit
MKDVIQFLNEVRLELSKVVWPKVDEWLGSTIIVLILVMVFALYLKAVDTGFSELIKYVIKTYGLSS